MSAPTWMPGPWSVSVNTSFPFNLTLFAGTDPIADFPRWGWASGAKTVEDVMLGVGFDHKKRPEIVAANARQVATVTLMAAAPDLYGALESTLSLLKVFTSRDDSIAKAVWDQAEAALAKAEGRQP